MAGEEWPSCWEAVSVLTRSEIRVATVLREVCGVTHSRPGSSRIFDYVVGVGRWALRVQAYAFLLLTDSYPPFSLH
jgi:hypothetical protein